MRRNETQRHPDPRGAHERGAAQSLGSQPQAEDEEDEQPERTPSFLTARELQASSMRPQPAVEAAPRKGREVRSDDTSDEDGEDED